MMDKYTPRERIETILAGEKPDRFAASFWRHFFHKEHYAEGTAEAMIDFQEKFKWDFIKINPRADYHVEGWGFEQEFSHDEFKKHTKLKFPVKSVDDWSRIEPLKPHTPSLDEHLRVVSIIRKELGWDLPILMTVFTPIAIAGRMVEDRQMLADHIRESPDKVLPAIEAITQTFEAFASEVRNAGADGLFFATTQWASSDMMTWEDFQKFGIPFDQRVIKAAEDDALNLFHICSSNNFLGELAQVDYGSKLYNWDFDDPTNSPLDKADDLLPDKVLVGGVDHNGWLLHSSAEEVGFQIDRFKAKFDPSRVILGPGCAIPPEVSYDNLTAIRERL